MMDMNTSSGSAILERVQRLQERGEFLISKDSKPAWLLSNFDDPIWVIRDGTKSRLVSGEWKGVIRIHWPMKLAGGGELGEAPFDLLLQHLKLLTMAHIESPARGADTTKGIDKIALLLKGLAEWLVFNRREQAALFGMKCLDPQAIRSFMWDYRRFGNGPAVWMQAFDSFLTEQYADSDERAKVDAWEASADPGLLDELDSRLIASPSIVVQPIEPKVFTLPEDVLRFAGRWLRMKGWFAEDGRLMLDRAATAINVDADRMSNHAEIKFYLRQFENLLDYRPYDFVGFREKIGHRQETVFDCYRAAPSENSLRLVFWQMSQLLRYVPYCADLKDDKGLRSIALEGVEPELRGGWGSHTPSMPVDIALFIYERAIHWTLHYSGPLTDYYLQLMNWVIAKSGHARKRTGGIQAMMSARGLDEPTDWWEKAFESVPCPRELDDLKISRFYAWEESSMPRNADGSHPIAARLRQEMTVEHAMRLNFAALSILTAAFSVRRDDEIQGLMQNCLILDVSRRAWIDFGMCKRQVANVRLDQQRPIPMLLYNAFVHQKRLAEALIKAHNVTDPHLKDLLFVYPARNFGVTDPDRRTRLGAFDLFCDYIQVPCDSDDRRWYIRLHEARRFFALAFFWMYPEKGLEALSWFMGHENPEDTWRYIKDQLSGREITQIEAARTVSYIRNENTPAAEQLRDFAIAHFKVDDLALISNAALEDYLACLIDEGCYTIEPKSLNSGDFRYELVVKIFKEPEDGAIETR